MPLYVDKQRTCMLISATVNKPLILCCLALTLSCAPLLHAVPADKPTCAVLTFDARSGISKDEALALTDRFSVELDRLGQYTRISREKQKEMLEEEVFSRSENCSATECALEVGRQLAAQYMIYGSLGKVGQTYTVYAVLVDVDKRVAAGVKIHKAGFVRNPIEPQIYEYSTAEYRRK